MTATTEDITRPDEVIVTETSDDPDKSAHIVMVPPGEPDQSPQAYVLRARVEGFPVTAVCGHKWIPTRNPEPLPVCGPCMEFYQTHGSDLGDRNGPPNA